MSTHPDNRLLAEALEAHGGLDRWRSFRGLSSTIVTGGGLWGIKGVEMPPTPRIVTTDFHRQWMAVSPFGDPDWTMTWTPQQVVVEDSAGAVIAEQDNPRDAFADHGYDTPWDPMHLAYFNGYAMWTYHASPFVLAGPSYEVSDLPPIEHDGEMLRGLHVRFPEGVHSHSREQQYYFDADGLLRRHDYSVDVWANERAAHMLSDYTEIDGLRFPTRRHVHPRKPDGLLRHDFTTVTIKLSNYTLR